MANLEFSGVLSLRYNVRSVGNNTLARCKIKSAKTTGDRSEPLRLPLQSYGMHYCPVLGLLITWLHSRNDFQLEGNNTWLVFTCGLNVLHWSSFVRRTFLLVKSGCKIILTAVQFACCASLKTRVSGMLHLAMSIVQIFVGVQTEKQRVIYEYSYFVLILWFKY